jgi:hypothetical protein
VLGLALLAIAGASVAALPVAAALTARQGSRPTSRTAALLFCAALPLPLLAVNFPLLLAAFVLLGTGRARRLDERAWPPPATAGKSLSLYATVLVLVPIGD